MHSKFKPKKAENLSLVTTQTLGKVSGGIRSQIMLVYYNKPKHNLQEGQGWPALEG
jgi:hypothetical protein